MSIATFFIAKEDLDGGLMHSPGTLILRLGGKDAIKATISSILSLLKLTGNDVMSWLCTGLRTLLCGSSDLKTTQINKKTFGFDNSMKVEVAPLEEEKVKVTLHWVSPSLQKKKEEEIFSSFAEEGTRPKVNKVGLTDKWSAWVKVRKNFELPHYVQLRYEGDPRAYKVLVTVPGRRQRCWHCGQDQHWSNQCPTKKIALIRSEPRPISDVPVPLTYASALKGDKLMQPKMDQWLKGDGFTLVTKKKHTKNDQPVATSTPVRVVEQKESQVNNTGPSRPATRKRSRSVDQLKSAQGSPFKPIRKK